MTEKPPQTRTRKKRLDAVDWYPFFLRYEAGMTASEVAQMVGRSVSQVYSQMAKMRRLDAAGLSELRDEALRRMRLLAEAELLTGDPAAATRTLNGCTALHRAEREERISHMETRNAATPAENKEAKLSDAEVERLRADLHRRFVLCEPAQPERANPAGCQPGGGNRAPS
ncbi:hypothetical protein [Maricaulis sp.]|uniref:hypothetical protein n=1 Tax=Maricaulis sp. TaxID=1486257 RepID=UPI003A95B03B